jgi:hypothetical protein
MPNGPSRPSADRAWRLNEHGSEHGMVLSWCIEQPGTVAGRLSAPPVLDRSLSYLA